MLKCLNSINICTVLQLIWHYIDAVEKVSLVGSPGKR